MSRENPSPRPKLILVGGANGSGKTTLARELVVVESLPYLGVDEIAYELNAAQPSSVAIAAARQFSQRLETVIVNLAVNLAKVAIK